MVGPDGTDTLTSVERAVFDDQTVIMEGLPPLPAQQIRGIGDFTGDGKSDLLWIDTSGQVAFWKLYGSFVAEELDVRTLPSGWFVRGARRFQWGRQERHPAGECRQFRLRPADEWQLR